MCHLNEAGTTLTSAASVGHDGAVWAQSEHFPSFSAQQVAILVAAVNEDDPILPPGGCFLVGGRKYLCIQSAPGTQNGTEVIAEGVTAPKGGISVYGTAQTLIIGIWHEPATGPAANTVTEKLGAYLKDSGF